MSETAEYQSGETPFIRTKQLTRSKEAITDPANKLVTELEPGETIAYVIQPKTGTNTYGASVGSGTSATEVTHWANGMWAAIAKKTDGDPLDVGTYRIRWTLTIGGGTAIEDDQLTIKP